MVRGRGVWTWCLSSGGSGGSTGSSAGWMKSIPWSSGAEWTPGRCFGNQDVSRSADEERKNETKSCEL